MNKMKKIPGQYYQPTPKKWRRIGDGLLAVSTMMTAYTIGEDMKVLSLVFLFIGAIGKFITNFFTETTTS